MSQENNGASNNSNDANNHNDNIYYHHQPGHQYPQVDFSYMGPDGFQHNFFPNHSSTAISQNHAAAAALYQQRVAYEGWPLNNYGHYSQLMPGSLPSSAPSAPYLNGQPPYAASTAPAFVSQPSPSPSPKLGNLNHDSAHDPTPNPFYTSFSTRTQADYNDLENPHTHSSPDTGDLSALGATAALPIERGIRIPGGSERSIDDWMKRTYISPPLETSAEDESSFMNIQNMTLKSESYEEEEAEQRKEETWSTDQQIDDSERRENSWKTDDEESHECKVEEIVEGIQKLGKTRTKDKYRVVYTDFQRVELEREFHYNRYITIKRKSCLASELNLSERQVKIWFQNRRAKERKLMKKESGRVDNPYVQIQYPSPHHQQMPPHHSPHHPSHHTPIHPPHHMHHPSHYLTSRQPRSS